MNEEKLIEMKAEAVARLRALKVMPEVANEFEEKGRLFYSERQNKMFPATLYWLSNRPDLVTKAKEIEKEYDCIVYHAIMTHLVDGDMVDYLIVTKHESEWPYERKELKDGIVLSHCVSPYAEESGSIAVRPAMGGLMRQF